MKKIFSILILFLTVATFAQTRFYFYAKNADGSAMTNPVTFQAWPPNANGWTVVGTNLVYGAAIYTNTPSASGFVSNSLYANQYRYYVPTTDSGFIFQLTDNTNYTSLVLYATNTPSTGGAGSGYQIITNLLGYTPATNNPLTNTIAYVSGFVSVTNGQGYITNINVTLATNTIYYQSR
jgi:hypothetical protein